MRTAQQGDRVSVHYVMRCQDGSMRSSDGRPPIEVTVGKPHPRLPGLGLALVGMAKGERKTLTVPPEQAYGVADPARVQRWHRKRFPEQVDLQVGQFVRVEASSGRSRLVRILGVEGEMVRVDANHRRAGQSLELEVHLVTIGLKDEG